MSLLTILSDLLKIYKLLIFNYLQTYQQNNC